MKLQDLILFVVAGLVLGIVGVWVANEIENPPSNLSKPRQNTIDISSVKYELIQLNIARERAKTATQKIIIVCLDGLSWRIVYPLMEKGLLPHFQKLLNEGVSATLVDEPPLDSVKIWTTIATGHPPTVHGIHKRVYTNTDRSQLIPATSSLRRCKALWNYFTDMGKTVGIIN